MAVIGLASLTYDADGARFIKQSPDVDNDNNAGGRRCSRVATLDGGAIMNDSGYSAADRTYTVKTRDDTGDIAAWAERIVQTYSTVSLATKHGFFNGTPSRWWVRDGYIYIEILITEEIE